MTMTETLPSPPVQRLKKTPSSLFAVLMLALCCVFWGFSFPTAQRVTASIASLTPQGVSDAAMRVSFNGWRFTAAAVCYFLMTFPRQRNYTAREVRGGLIIAVFFSLAVLLQLIGIRYTLPSTSAFLTALAVVILPLVQALVLRRKVSGRVWISIAIAIAGMLLLSYPANAEAAAGTLVQRPPVPFLGEILTVGCAVMCTGHILSVDRYGRDCDPARLTFLMLAFGGLLSFIIGISMGSLPGHNPHLLRTLFTDFSFLWQFAGMVLLSSTGALHLMNRYQPHVSPAVATVVYCLEPVFGTLFSVAFGTESLTLLTAGGGIAIILAVTLLARSPSQS